MKFIELYVMGIMIGFWLEKGDIFFCIGVMMYFVLFVFSFVEIEKYEGVCVILEEKWVILIWYVIFGFLVGFCL